MKKLLKKATINSIKLTKTFKRILNGSKKFLTLDIGNHTIKMLEYMVDESKIHVTGGFIVATPSNAYVNGTVVDIDKMVEVIEPKIKSSKIITKKLCVSVESDEIISREMLIPKIKDEEYNNFITSNSSDIFPMNLATYSLGYSIIEEFRDKAVNMVRIMIVAIPKIIIMRYIELAEGLQLELKSINYSGYELYNFIDFEMQEKDEGYAVIDFGAKSTNLIVVSKGVLKFNRLISKGSDNITQEISEELGCALNKAEQLKKQYNSVIILGKLKKDADVYKVAQITQDVISDVMQDVLRIIEFYNINNAKNRIVKVYLTGLGSKISGIEEFIEGLIGIPVTRIKEFSHVSFEGEAKRLRNRQLTFINCLGANTLKQRKFNFIKGDLKFTTFNVFKKTIFYKSVLCVYLLIGLVAAAIYCNMRLIERETKKYNAFIDTKVGITNLQKEIEDENAILNNTKEILKSIGTGAETYREKLENIEKVVDEMSKNVRITVKKYELSTNSIIISCTAESLKDNYLDDMDYMNAPYDLEDNLNVYFNCERGRSQKPESFTLTLKFKD